MQSSHLGFVVLFYIAVGMFISLGFLRSVFFRLYSCLTLAMIAGLSYLALGNASLSMALDSSVFCFLLCTAGYALAARSSPVLARTFYGLGAVAGLAAVLFDLKLEMAQVVPLDRPIPLFMGNALLSVLLLGFTGATLLTGSWRLYHPKRAARDLSRMALAFAIVSLIRLAFGAYLLRESLTGMTGIEMYRYLLSPSPGIAVALRFMWGLIGPFLLACLVWKTQRQGSAYATTGILVVATFCVLFGEFLSHYLAFFYALAL